MGFAENISLHNLKGRPVRTAALMLLAAFLSMSVFGGSLIVRSLQNGLDSYEARLGADIIVVPYEARTKATLDSILLQGIPGYFYMDSSYLDKIRSTDGVEVATPQFFLASASAGCCSVPVQIIGFDPETDFSVRPWISRSYSGDFGDGDILVGSDISIPTNGVLTFYNVPCRVVAQLGQTGTGLDTAVYANMNTIRSMMEGSLKEGFNYLGGMSVDRAISSVMVKVKEGYDITSVNNDINIHVRHVKATQAKSMISGISSGLTGVSRIIGMLTLMIWILAAAILTLAFFMISNERKKEFAILRVMGATKGMLSRMFLTEAAIISLVGALCGVVLAAVAIVPFGSLIRSRLELPYLMPDLGAVLFFAAGAVGLAVLVGAVTAYISARRIAKNETGLILREGA